MPSSPEGSRQPIDYRDDAPEIADDGRELTLEELLAAAMVQQQQKNEYY